ncbi:MAG: rhomboid family intramembrane serine protease [Desulfobacterales bacterium]|nr:MAG: rhomboid family intramembrane serine protease [Desulfobacterales bacterium]
MTTQYAKNSMLCPNCRRLISRDEGACPYCGTSRPGSWWKNNRFTAGFADENRIISLIIYTNIGMYILSLLLNPRSAGLAINPFDFLSPSNRSLLILGSTGTVAITELHRWWSLVSANYLHGSLLHIVFNIIALRQIGHLVIHEYGSYRMFVIYTLGGVAGFFLSFLAGIHFTIGASASVCSLIGAMLYYGKSRGGTYGRNIYSQIGVWAVSIFVFGLIVPGINNWGHGGGMAAGALLAFLLGYQERKRENISHKFLAIGCAALTAMILAWASLNGILYLLLA